MGGGGTDFRMDKLKYILHLKEDFGLHYGPFTTAHQCRESEPVSEF